MPKTSVVRRFGDLLVAANVTNTSTEFSWELEVWDKLTASPSA